MPAKNKGSIGTRIKAAIIIIVGVIMLVLGIGMWVSPEVNWEGFMGAWGLLGDEFARLKDDPFAILGILVIVASSFVIYYGIKRLVRGKS
ncbi:MAG: hypothetical protein PHY28_09440 [Dehalococcoidales bacterium]|nr:hypothetical protein [Dehalococcoidales bacterium]